MVALRILVLLVLVPSAGLAEGDSGYRYSIDWTGQNVKVWEQVLSGVKGKPGSRGLEVGCFEGRSTIWFLDEVLTDPSSTMTCIDVFTDEIEASFDHNVKLSGHGDRLIKRKGYSQDVLRGLEVDSYDFVYIDGCHLASCALTDMVLSWDLLEKGGIMILDDYSWKLGAPIIARPKFAIDAFIEVFRDKLRVRYLGRQVVLQKTQGHDAEALVGKPVVHEDGWSSARKKD